MTAQILIVSLSLAETVQILCSQSLLLLLPTCSILTLEILLCEACWKKRGRINIFIRKQKKFFLKDYSKFHKLFQESLSMSLKTWGNLQVCQSERNMSTLQNYSDTQVRRYHMKVCSSRSIQCLGIFASVQLSVLS